VDEKLLKQGIPNCGAPSISMRWLTHWVWYQIRLHFSEPENLKKIVEDLSSGDTQRERLLKDRERLEERIGEIERQTARMLKQLSQFDDDWLIESYQRQLKELAKQRRSIDDSIKEIDILVKQLDRTRPDISRLYELSEELFWGEENWSDEERSEKLIAGGFRASALGHSFEISGANGFCG
jgi:chromosome segregation ATPase